jgi:hypothetical protein
MARPILATLALTPASASAPAPPPAATPLSALLLVADSGRGLLASSARVSLRVIVGSEALLALTRERPIVVVLAIHRELTALRPMFGLIVPSATTASAPRPATFLIAFSRFRFLAFAAQIVTRLTFEPPLHVDGR